MKYRGFEKYKQSFGLVSKEYKKYRGSYNAKLYKLLLSLLKKGKGDAVSVLDLGCGVGNSTEPVLHMANVMKLKPAIVGCDIDGRMLKEARLSAKKNKLPLTYVVAKAEKLPFAKTQFDLVISGAAFHWFANKKAMKEVQRVLKPGGIYFVFWTQNREGKNTIIGQDLYRKYKWQGIPRDLRYAENVRDVFVQNGFADVTTLKIPHTDKRTMNEAIGLIKTNSSYALLSPKDKTIFIREMRTEYKKVLGNRVDVVKQEFNVCYGVKPDSLYKI